MQGSFLCTVRCIESVIFVFHLIVFVMPFFFPAAYFPILHFFPLFIKYSLLPYALRFAQGFFHIIEVRFAAAGSHNSHGNIPFGIVRLAEAFCPAINKPGPFIFVYKPQLQPVIFKQFYHPPYLFIRSLHFSAHPSQYFQPLIGLYGQAHLRGSLSRRRQTLPSQITLADSAITACRPAPDDPYPSLSTSALLPLPAVFRPDALQAAAAAA